MSETHKRNNIQPAHYHSGSGDPRFDLIESWFQTLPWEQFRGVMKANIIKYVTRYDMKNGDEDLFKATEYVERLLSYEVRHMEEVRTAAEGH